MRRGQLVLAAAGILALALVPVALAYVQLGYHPDVDAAGGADRPLGDAERTLDRAVGVASAGITPNYTWDRRGAAVERVRERLRPRFETLRTARVTEGTVYRIEYNGTAARERARTCPRGPDRRFGPCEARSGVVVQERAGRAHVLAVALDVRVVTRNGERAATFVLEPGRSPG